MEHIRGLLLVVGISLLAMTGLGRTEVVDCTVPTSFYDTEPLLPKTTAALTSGQSVFVIVLGGASTLGGAAGGIEHAWPARLAAALRHRFPATRVVVDNRAVARQTAQAVESRLEKEILTLKPTLVIWETGTTDAVRGTEPDEFRQTLQTGIDRLRTSGTEVVCMDMQFSRHTHAVINFDKYKSVLREVADANDVPLFRRHDIMRYWAEGGLFDLSTEDRDRLQWVATRLYDCIGLAMAEFMTRGVQTGASLPAAPPEQPRKDRKE
jgi:hypothetical protein